MGRGVVWFSHCLRYAKKNCKTLQSAERSSRGRRFQYEKKLAEKNAAAETTSLRALKKCCRIVNTVDFTSLNKPGENRKRRNFGGKRGKPRAGKGKATKQTIFTRGTSPAAHASSPRAARAASGAGRARRATTRAEEENRRPPPRPPSAHGRASASHAAASARRGRRCVSAACGRGAILPQRAHAARGALSAAADGR